jgi:hypothetical protein
MTKQSDGSLRDCFVPRNDQREQAAFAQIEMASFLFFIKRHHGTLEIASKPMLPFLFRGGFVLRNDENQKV